jgi:isopentenyldiphosphate isomerase
MADHEVNIVNLNDQVIGHKLRSQRTKSDIYRISALWLTNPKGDILLAQRSETKEYNPGLWGPAAAGTVEAGESYVDNIYKEAQEEIGLTGIAFTANEKELVLAEHRYFCQWFTATVDWPLSAFKLQEEEVKAIRWVDPAILHKDLQDHPERYSPRALDRWSNLLKLK